MPGETEQRKRERRRVPVWGGQVTGHSLSNLCPLLMAQKVCGLPGSLMCGDPLPTRRDPLGFIFCNWADESGTLCLTHFTCVKIQCVKQIPAEEVLALYSV